MRGGPAARVALVGAMLGLLAVGGCGGDDGDGDDSTALPAGAVAVVGDEPITAGQLERHTELLRNGRRGAAAQDAAGLEQEALEKLLLQAAIEAEARQRDVHVDTAPAVKQAAAMRARYPNRAAFHRFLGGLSERDLVRQLRLSALSARLLADVRRQGGERPAAFLDALPGRWTERTTCLEQYSDTPGCGG